MPEKKTKKRKKGVARKKKDDRPEKAAASSEAAGKPIQSNKADADLGEEARQLATAVEGVSQSVEARAQATRKLAEEALEEPMRSRIRELDMQARISCRDLFRDLAMEKIEGDKITSAWVAAYSKKHGFS